jgi:hypothetical protein
MFSTCRGAAPPGVSAGAAAAAGGGGAASFLASPGGAATPTSGSRLRCAAGDLGSAAALPAVGEDGEEEQEVRAGAGLLVHTRPRRELWPSQPRLLSFAAALPSPWVFLSSPGPLLQDEAPASSSGSGQVADAARGVSFTRSPLSRLAQPAIPEGAELASPGHADAVGGMG